MHRDRIRLRQQRVQRGHRLRIAVRQLAGAVPIDDAHAEGFGEHRQLAADIAIADDAEGLAAHFPGIRCRLVPLAAMRRVRFGEDAAHQHHDLAQRQLGDGARVGKRRIEHRNATMRRRFQIHLVGADAEAADGEKPIGRFQHLGRHLGA